MLYVTFSRPFDKMPDMVTRYIPLFQLVYNGIILSNPFTTTVNAMKKGRPSELKIVEFNARPSFYYYANFLSNGRNWMGDEDLTCDDDAALVKSVADVKRCIDGYDPDGERQERNLNSLFRHFSRLCVSLRSLWFPKEIQLPNLGSIPTQATTGWPNTQGVLITIFKN